jgi:hypothetical protein
VGISEAAKMELVPRKQAAAQNFFTTLIRTVAPPAQEAAVVRHERKQCLAAKQAALGLRETFRGEPDDFL